MRAALDEHAPPIAAGEPVQGQSKAARPPQLAAIDGDLLRDVQVSLEASLGQADMTVAELMALKSGSVVTLASSLAEPVELLLNGTVVARGEIVAVGEHFGVRITEIAES